MSAASLAPPPPSNMSALDRPPPTDFFLEGGEEGREGREILQITNQPMPRRTFHKGAFPKWRTRRSQRSNTTVQVGTQAFRSGLESVDVVNFRGQRKSDQECVEVHARSLHCRGAAGVGCCEFGGRKRRRGVADPGMKDVLPLSQDALLPPKPR